MKSNHTLAALALTFVLLFSLAACGNGAAQLGDSASDGTSSAAQAATNGVATDAPSSPDALTAATPDAVDVEEGEPLDSAAVDAGGTAPSADATENVCVLSISCAALLEHADALDADTLALVPSDGVLLAPTEAAFDEDESVFDVLRRVCRENKLHMEFSSSPVYGSAYIEGIGNLYEFDCGDGSGWMYRVNGEFPRVGCSQYTLRAGDTVEWVYTCDFGADVGGEASA